MGKQSKLSARSKIIGHVSFLDIREVREITDKGIIKSSKIGLYRGKKLIIDDLKTKENAILEGEKYLTKHRR